MAFDLGERLTVSIPVEVLRCAIGQGELDEAQRYAEECVKVGLDEAATRARLGGYLAVSVAQALSRSAGLSA